VKYFTIFLAKECPGRFNLPIDAEKMPFLPIPVSALSGTEKSPAKKIDAARLMANITRFMTGR
jgi:hypothetical protein